MNFSATINVATGKALIEEYPVADDRVAIAICVDPVSEG